MNYVQEVLDELAERLPDCATPASWSCTPCSHSQGAAGRRWRTNPRRVGHLAQPDAAGSRGPGATFIMLAPEVRELDRKYAEAIRPRLPRTWCLVAFLTPRGGTVPGEEPAP